jgi:hypothetical protein
MKRLVLKDRECSHSIYMPTTQPAYEIADQLTKSAREDCTCVLNRTEPVVTIASVLAGGDHIQANIWFTGSNPQTISVAFNCTKLANAITDLIGYCAPFSTNNQVGGMLAIGYIAVLKFRYADTAFRNAKAVQLYRKSEID